MIESIISWDRQIFTIVNTSWSNSALDAVFPWISRFGGFYLGVLPAALILVRRSVRALLGMGILLGTTVLTYEVVKHVVGRGRPFTQLDAIIRDGSYSVSNPASVSGAYLSFPSGHTALAFCLAALYGRAYPRTRPIFYSLASLVGLSRVYLGVHYFTDVVVGAAIGLALFQILTAHSFVRSALSSGRTLPMVPSQTP